MKLKQLDNTDYDWTGDMAGIKAPTLVLVGDQDVVMPEHAVDMLRLLGGGKPGDMGAPPPEDQLAILPGTSHIGVFMFAADKFGEIAADFIDPKPALVALPPAAEQKQ
jgi:pimeloyl-ACP methyl ester carboxylesterase